MKEIVTRLHENRQVALAKSILEANGYKVTMKKSAKSPWEFTKEQVEENFSDVAKRDFFKIYKEANGNMIDCREESGDIIIDLLDVDTSIIDFITKKLGYKSLGNGMTFLCPRDKNFKVVIEDVSNYDDYEEESGMKPHSIQFIYSNK